MTYESLLVERKQAIARVDPSEKLKDIKGQTLGSSPWTFIICLDLNVRQLFQDCA